MRLHLESEVEKFLADLPEKFAGQISRKLALLLQNPKPASSLKLLGFDGELRRLKIGEFRAIYRVSDDVIYVLLIDRRNDDAIYRRLERKKT